MGVDGEGKEEAVEVHPHGIAGIIGFCPQQRSHRYRRSSRTGLFIVKEGKVSAGGGKWQAEWATK